ncbi:Beta-soluble NSF attachment protein [Chelonia mydas]|uniref:Beta-soluble NSF attachment protein n=1 Tax=Chelonia mydas TaxID=8469 RepID=M7AWE1_CHEMY|nr:Beta-soluble NSF attachment protein [Chelonia mydas]
MVFGTLDTDGLRYQVHITDSVGADILALSTATSNDIFGTTGLLGAAFVEFDVHLSKDHVPVVYHDLTCCMAMKKDGKWDGNLSTYFDMNLFLDIILKTTLENAGRRRIVFSSFDADICTMVRQKQNKYPVLFLTQGKSDIYPELMDLRSRTTPIAMSFAQFENLLGINVHTEDLLRNPSYIQEAKSKGLVIFCWGDDTNDPDNRKKLREYGINGLIYDRIYDWMPEQPNIFQICARSSNLTGGISGCASVRCRGTPPLLPSSPVAPLGNPLGTFGTENAAKMATGLVGLGRNPYKSVCLAVLFLYEGHTAVSEEKSGWQKHHWLLAPGRGLAVNQLVLAGFLGHLTCSSACRINLGKATKVVSVQPRGNSKVEEACEMYTRAANLFKIAKNWNAAGNAFCQAAKLHMQLQSKHDAAIGFVDAGNAYKKADPQEAMNCLNAAIDIYTDLGRFTIAAKHHITIAEIYETELVDIEKATFPDLCAELAPDLQCGETKTRAALTVGKCLLKVAAYAAQLEQYQKAIEIYEQVGTNTMDNPLLKYSAKEYFFKAALCHFIVDELNAKLALEKYEEMFPAFTDSRECKLVKKLLEAHEDQNCEAYTEAVKEFDSISRLDQWLTTMLLRIKKSLQGDGDGDLK